MNGANAKSEDQASSPPVFMLNSVHLDIKNFQDIYQQNLRGRKLIYINVVGVAILF